MEDGQIKSRVENFLDSAKVDSLKEALSLLKLPTNGVKNALKLRLQEAFNNMSADQISELVPEESEDGDEESEEIADDEPEELDSEIERLRQVITKKQEIAQLRKQLAEMTKTEGSHNIKPPAIHFKDVEGSIPTFSGDDNFTIKRWMELFEESAETLNWDERMQLIFAKKLMTGTAKLFIRTASFKTWKDLKSALLSEFSTKDTKADIHDKLRTRKMLSSENWQQYMFAMQEIASHADIDEADTMQYIVRGGAYETPTTTKCYYTTPITSANSKQRSESTRN